MPVIPSFLWSDCRIQKTLWRLNPSWDYLLANLLLSLRMMRSSDETERRLPSRFHCKSYHISWIVTLFWLSLFSSTSSQSELSEFSCSSVLLAANSLPIHCKDVIWVTALRLSTYWPAPFDIWSVHAVGYS